MIRAYNAHTHTRVAGPGPSPGNFHGRARSIGPIGCIHGKPKKERRGKQGIEVVASIDRSSGHTRMQDDNDNLYFTQDISLF